LTRALKLTAQEVESLRPRQQIEVRFRTMRNTAVAQDLIEQVSELARTVLRLESNFGALRVDGIKKLPKKGFDNPEAVARHIQRQLCVPTYPLSLEQLVRALLVRGVPVVFCPFWEELRKAKIRAFTAHHDGESLIFVDSHTAFEDVAWLIVHELTHVLRGDGDRTTKESEEFCNAVATEVCTPIAFFRDHKAEYGQLLERIPLASSVHVVREIASSLGASFKGTILRMKEAGILQPNSAAFRYLVKVEHNERAARVKIADLILPGDTDDTAQWIAILKDPSKDYLLHLQLLVRDGIVQGKLSQGRATEMLGVDETVAAELINHWMPQDEDTALV
jgi:Zn-dependent peptidase ImmA (M78 family)